MNDFLFNEFDPVSPTAWKQKIQVDLEGKDYNSSLVWKTNEEISVKPFYTKEDRHNRKIKLPSEGYKTCQSIFIDKVSIANKLALDSIERGAKAIQFTAKKTFDFRTLLNNIKIKKCTIYFNFEFIDAHFIAQLKEYCNDKLTYFQIDIIGNLAKTGNWFSNFKDDISELEKFIYTTENTICVDASIYQNAGATIVQELAYALAHTNEYIELFGKSIASKIHYNFSIGSNYFFEIAKLRAFRMLSSTLLKEYNTQINPIHIFSRPSMRNKTIYDYNVNMLRTTSECMSAILGGSDTISNISYDSVYHKSNEFGERIARNQLLILKEETYLSDAQQYPNGSYYIESIEKQLAEKALNLFKEIEKKGGFLKQLKKGIIQKKITESANKEQIQFNNRQLILLGTNELPNLNERMRDELEIYPFLKSNNSKTLLQPILQKRISEEYEKERLKKELESSFKSIE